MRKTAGATNGEEDLSILAELTSGDGVARSSAFCVVFCSSLSVL